MSYLVVCLVTNLKNTFYIHILAGKSHHIFVVALHTEKRDNSTFGAFSREITFNIPVCSKKRDVPPKTGQLGKYALTISLTVQNSTLISTYHPM